MPTIRVIYDVRQALPGAWWVPMVFGLFAIIGWRLTRGQARPRVRMIAYGWLLTGAIGAAGSGAFTWGAHALACYRLATGGVRQVEGVVFGVRPGDAGGHQAEQWSVRTADGTATFAYVARQMGPGYAVIQPSGGEIREGMSVGVWAAGDRIVRLEIR